MKIALASDHAGFDYKESFKPLLDRLGHEWVDFGTDSTASVDYPLFIRPAAEALARGEVDRAIVLGGSGNGENIVANKVPGVRSVICWSEQTAIWGREHNNANCLAIGQRTIDQALAHRIVEVFLSTDFGEGRHARRVNLIEP